MARVKLDMPDRFIFSTDLKIRIGDINYGGHVGNDSMLSIVHEARVRFLQHYGFSEVDIDGVGMIMTDAVLAYKAESFYGDELVIRVAIAELTRTSCDFLFLITNKETGKEICRAKTGVAFFDYKTRRIREMPAKFKSVAGG